MAVVVPTAVGSSWPSFLNWRLLLCYEYWRVNRRQETELSLEEKESLTSQAVF